VRSPAGPTMMSGVRGRGVLILILLVARAGYGDGSFSTPRLQLPPVVTPWRIGIDVEVEKLVKRLRNDQAKWEAASTGLEVTITSAAANQLLGLPETLVKRALYQALADPSRFAVAHVLLTRRAGVPVAASSSEWNRLRVSARPDGTFELDPEQRVSLQAWWRGTLGY